MGVVMVSSSGRKVPLEVECGKIQVLSVQAAIVRRNELGRSKEGAFSFSWCFKSSWSGQSAPKFTLPSTNYSNCVLNYYENHGGFVFHNDDKLATSNLTVALQSTKDSTSIAPLYPLIISPTLLTKT